MERYQIQLKERNAREDELRRKKLDDRANAIKDIEKWRQEFVNCRTTRVKEEKQ